MTETKTRILFPTFPTQIQACVADCSLTVSAATVFPGNITGVVLTYAARWLYSYRSRSGMTVASTVVIWHISQDSISASGQLLGPFIPVHSSPGLSLHLFWLVYLLLEFAALICFCFSPLCSSQINFVINSNQRYLISCFF